MTECNGHVVNCLLTATSLAHSLDGEMDRQINTYESESHFRGRVKKCRGRRKRRLRQEQDRGRAAPEGLPILRATPFGGTVKMLQVCLQLNHGELVQTPWSWSHGTKSKSWLWSALVRGHYRLLIKHDCEENLGCVSTPHK